VGALEALIGPDELAVWLGIPLATIYRWSSRKEGPPAFKIGKYVKYQVSDVQAWLQAQRRD
jgi:predicted DNA-binding transcriptional regulator AlpA